MHRQGFFHELARAEEGAVKKTHTATEATTSRGEIKSKPRIPVIDRSWEKGYEKMAIIKRVHEHCLLQLPWGMLFSAPEKRGVVLISLCKPSLLGRIDISQDDGGLCYGEEREEGQQQVA